MNEIVCNDGQKRRLPVWMVGAKKSDENSDAIKDKNEEKSRVEPLEAKCETKRRKRKLNQPKLEIGERRKRTLSQQNVGFEKKMDGDKDRRAAWESESTTEERGKANSSSMVESDEEIESPSGSEDDAELTLEDLVSIAKEYVKDNKDMEQRPSGSHDAPQSKATCINNLTENSTSERIVVNSTGNPAQDMLDLFLGPLLKKPTEDKKIASISEDLTFSYDYKPKNHKDVLEEDLAPLMKKKSSLKDKVAMFLN